MVRKGIPQHRTTVTKASLENYLPSSGTTEGLDNAGRVRDKMRVVYKEIIRDRAKSNVAKRNLIGGMPLKHIKNCLMFM